MSAAATVRPMTREDLDAVGRLATMLVEMHHHLDPQRFIAATPETPAGYARFLGSQMGKKDVILLVAERDGTVVGYVYAGIEGFDYMALRGPAGAIYDIVVDPAHRCVGIGKLLLERAASALEAGGAPRILLSTADKNGSAQRLFERAGFRRTMIEMTRERGERG